MPLFVIACFRLFIPLLSSLSSSLASPLPLLHCLSVAIVDRSAACPGRAVQRQSGHVNRFTSSCAADFSLSSALPDGLTDWAHEQPRRGYRDKHRLGRPGACASLSILGLSCVFIRCPVENQSAFLFVSVELGANTEHEESFYSKSDWISTNPVPSRVLFCRQKLCCPGNWVRTTVR
ncbi:unnamed protein product [Protopolystoma xenopodis]|uniref:Secreted protein n=1 Tax=Protopolystoma xenopodis TaxID=117903 RepID=A0A448XH69_9PLAT|nr:unnamed protein product [Protopolystoma xenopodis]